jgi:hypothetical protein
MLLAWMQSRPRDPAIVSATVVKLEQCGAIEACNELARRLVEESWQRCELLLEPSSAKVMLRAFGWFVLERHY